MTNEGTTESRVSRLERDGARDGQRLAELERRVDALTPLLTSVVTLTVEFKNMREDLSAFMAGVEKRDKEREARDADRDKDRLYSRRALVSVGVALLCALIGAVAVLLSAH
jgi:cell division protein FtsX